MFDAKQRIIGAAYAIPEHILKIVWDEIQRLQPIEEGAPYDEIAASVVLELNNYTENDKREQIIGAATTMSKNDASKIWKIILDIISIPESTEEELFQAINESLAENDENNVE